eukprot:1158878-Pelagomonas_calceolata.AAC.9
MPPEQRQSTQPPSAYLRGCPCWVGGRGVPVPGTLQSTCGPFQLDNEPMGSHNSECNRMFNLCSIDGVMYTTN